MSSVKPVIADGEGLSRLKWEYELERSNKPDLLCFGTADMDYRCAQPILDALQEVLVRGHLGYYYPPDSYYQAIENWLVRITDWKLDAYTCMAQFPGIYQAAWAAIHVLTKPGDKVVILSPVHFCYKNILSLNGRTPIECPLVLKQDEYVIDYGALEACFRSGATMIWLCNPHNPIGKAWEREELQKVADLCLKYDVAILSDDVYAPLTYEGIPYTAIASLSREISEQTVTLYSISKGYNTAALRNAFAVTESPILYKEIRDQMDVMNLNYGMNIMGDVATEAALNHGDEWLRGLKEEIAWCQNYVSERFANETKRCRVIPANAAYFAWMDLRALRIPPQRLAYMIEEEAHILVENGFVLGKGGAGFIRMNLAADRKVLKEGMDRLIAFVQAHEK